MDQQHRYELSSVTFLEISTNLLTSIFARTWYTERANEIIKQRSTKFHKHRVSSRIVLNSAATARILVHV